MTKEQIIIDGVDVSACKHINNYTRSLTGEIMCYTKPCKGQDCDLKQLARKTQECEELREKLDFRTKKLTEDLSCSNKCLRKRMVQCSRYRKALEEIEEYQKRNCEVCSFAETKKM